MKLLKTVLRVCCLTLAPLEAGTFKHRDMVTYEAGNGEYSRKNYDESEVMRGETKRERKRPQMRLQHRSGE